MRTSFFSIGWPQATISIASVSSGPAGSAWLRLASDSRLMRSICGTAAERRKT